MERQSELLLCAVAVPSFVRLLCSLPAIRRCGGTGDDLSYMLCPYVASRTILALGTAKPTLDGLERTERTGSAFGPGEMAAGWALGAAKLPSRDDGAQCTRETTMSCHS